MEQKRKRRFLILCTAMVMLLCVLSGCRRHATQEELIDWFQEYYTDAPLVVSDEAVEDEENRIISYEAHLQNRPELVFYLQSRPVMVGMHSEYHNFTNFDNVYGTYYFALYQQQHPVQYWAEDEDPDYLFWLRALYSTPDELEAAIQELLDICQFFREQAPAVDAEYSFTFQPPICAPEHFSSSLGSDSMFLATDDPGTETAIRQMAKDLRSELAVWCSFYGLHLEWFSEAELALALAYTQTDSYGGSPPYIGAWNISDPEKGKLRIPLVAPNTWSFSLAQLYRLLLALEWETLEGSETDFTFVGVDGSTYALSYTLWETEKWGLVNRCTKDGVPMYVREGAFFYSDLTEMTGVVLMEESSVTYRGPDEDGIVRLPSGPVS